MQDKFRCLVPHSSVLIVCPFKLSLIYVAGNQLPPSPEQMQEMMNQVSGSS